MTQEQPQDPQKDLQEDQQVNTAEQQIAELTALCQRIQADFDNFRKRTQEERVQLVNSANATLVGHLLPVLDAMELSLQHAHATDVQTLQQVVQGMQYIKEQLASTLQHSGLQEIPTDGQQFDPYKHQPLTTVKADETHPDNTVVETKQKGYAFNGKVIRSAKVVVAKKEESEHAKAKNDSDNTSNL